MATIQTYQRVIDSLTTSTWYRIRKGRVDQTFKIHPFLDRMVENNRIRAKVPDGTHYEVPLRYALQDQNLKYFGRGAEFGTTEKEFLTPLIYETKNLGNSVKRFFDDDRKNRGPSRILSYSKEVVDAAFDAVRDKLANDILVQSPDVGSITSIDSLIVTDPTTGTVGKLDRSENPYLANQKKDFSSLTTKANLLDEMSTMINLCSEYQSGNRRTPDHILMNRTTYQDFEKIGRAMRTIDTLRAPRVDLGLGGLSYRGIEVYWDPRLTNVAGQGKVYILNTETFEFLYDPAAFFEMEPWKTKYNDLDRYSQIYVIGNLTCNMFAKNGVIFNITTETS